MLTYTSREKVNGTTLYRPGFGMIEAQHSKTFSEALLKVQCLKRSPQQPVQRDTLSADTLPFHVW